jgi:2-iminobutanoate/2-iminopropanoate deaminase
MKKIYTIKAPEPGGHYSQAVVHKNIVYVSGQLPIISGVTEEKPKAIEAQTQQALENIDAILRAAGSSRGQVIKTTVYIADISLWDRVNNVYAKFFGDHRPARAIVPTRNLHFGFQIEIEAMAVIVE